MFECFILFDTPLTIFVLLLVFVLVPIDFEGMLADACLAACYQVKLTALALIIVFGSCLFCKAPCSTFID